MCRRADRAAGATRRGTSGTDADARAGRTACLRRGGRAREKLLNRVGGAAKLIKADEHPDAVIDVHDEVVYFEIAEIRQEGLRRRAAPLRGAPLFLEDVGF